VTRISRLSSCAVICCMAAAALAGCASQSPVGVQSMPQDVTSGARAGRSSWMLAKAKNENLLYVADGNPSGGGYVSVYSYPRGNLVGTLTGFFNPAGVCADNVGDIFITDTNARKVVEYAHGGSQSKETLGDGDQPIGCAVDPITGNLAVANLGGTVAIYRNARGNAKYLYFSTEGDADYCGYDNAGNLFVDGMAYQGLDYVFQLVELARGEQSFKVITVNKNVEAVGQVQWDGKYVAVGDSEQHLIYRVDVTRTYGIVKKTIHLVGGGVNGFLIRGRRLIDASYSYDEVQYFNYPDGGTATKVITRDVSRPASAAISPK
jgi:hypothetical protein